MNDGVPPGGAPEGFVRASRRRIDRQSLPSAAPGGTPVPSSIASSSSSEPQAPSSLIFEPEPTQSVGPSGQGSGLGLSSAPSTASPPAAPQPTAFAQPLGMRSPPPNMSPLRGLEPTTSRAAASILDPVPGEPEFSFEPGEFDRVVDPSTGSPFGFDGTTMPQGGSTSGSGGAGASAGASGSAGGQNEDDIEFVRLKLKETKSLSDALKATYDKRSRNEIYFSFNRDLPRQFGGRFVAGHMGRWTTAFTEEEVVRALGGGTYTVDVEAVDLNAPARDDGFPNLKKVHSFRFSSYGDPKIPTEEKPEVSQAAGVDKFMQSFAVAALDGISRRPAATGDVGPTVNAVAQMADRVAEAERSRSNDIAGLYQQRLDDERTRRLEAEDKARKEAEAARSSPQEGPLISLLGKLVETRSATPDRASHEESYADRIERINAQHREDLRMRESVFNERLQMARADNERAIEALRREHERTQDSQSKDYDRRIKDVTDRYESEIARILKDKEGEIQRLREQQEFERRIQEQTSRLQVTTVETVSSANANALALENSRLTQKLAQLELEVASLRAKVFIPVEQEIARSIAVAKKVGYIHESDAPEAPPNENSITAVIGNIAKAAGPDVIRRVIDFALPHVQGAGGGAPMALPGAPGGAPPALPPHQPNGAPRGRPVAGAGPGTAPGPNPAAQGQGQGQGQGRAPAQGGGGQRRAVGQTVARPPARRQEFGADSPFPGPTVPPPGVRPYESISVGDPRAQALANPAHLAEAPPEFIPPTTDGSDMPLMPPGATPAGGAPAQVEGFGRSGESTHGQMEAPSALPSGFGSRASNRTDEPVIDFPGPFEGAQTALPAHSGAPGGASAQPHTGPSQQQADLPPAMLNLTDEERASAEAFQREFKSFGEPPVPPEQFGAVMVPIAQALTVEMRSGKDARAAVRENWLVVQVHLSKFRDWVNARNAARLCAELVPGVGWEQEIGINWLRDAWAEIDILRGGRPANEPDEE